MHLYAAVFESFNSEWKLGRNFDSQFLQVRTRSTVSSSLIKFFLWRRNCRNYTNVLWPTYEFILFPSKDSLTIGTRRVDVLIINERISKHQIIPRRFNLHILAESDYPVYWWIMILSSFRTYPYLIFDFDIFQRLAAFFPQGSVIKIFDLIPTLVPN